MSKVSSSVLFVKTHSHGGQEGSAEPYWAPNTDVYVNDGGLVIKVELAGMKREDLELIVEGNRVKITGHRPDGGRAPKCKFLLMEICYGAFSTVIELPDGYDLGRAQAGYQNGFLRIDVPLQGGAIEPQPSPIGLAKKNK